MLLLFLWSLALDQIPNLHLVSIGISICFRLMAISKQNEIVFYANRRERDYAIENSIVRLQAFCDHVIENPELCGCVRLNWEKKEQ